MSYRGYQARRELAPVAAPPGKLEILRKVPPGSRRICSRHVAELWPAGLKEHPGFQRRRGDRQASILAFAAQLAAKAVYADATTFHSRLARAAAAGRCESTWKAARRDLEDWGCLAEVRPGRIYWHRSQVRHDPAVYVLCLPKSVLRRLAATRRRASPSALTRPPTVSPSVSPSGPAREGLGTASRRGPPSGRAHLRVRPPDPAAAAVAAVVRQALGQTITEGWVSHSVRKYREQGYSEKDIKEALEAGPEPCGQLHRFLPASVRSARRVLAWRLSRWDDPLGRPWPPPSQLRAYRATRIRQAAARLLARTFHDPAANEAIREQLRAQPWVRDYRRKKGIDP